MLIIASHFCCFVSIYLLFHLCKSLCAACCVKAAVQIKLIDGWMDWLLLFIFQQPNGRNSRGAVTQQKRLFALSPGSRTDLKRKQAAIRAQLSMWQWLIDHIPNSNKIINQSSVPPYAVKPQQFLAAWGQKCRRNAQSGISNDGIRFFLLKGGG